MISIRDAKVPLVMRPGISMFMAFRRLLRSSPNAPSSIIPIFSRMAVATWAFRQKNGFTMPSAAL
jgi:hypothetical protein